MARKARPPTTTTRSIAEQAPSAHESPEHESPEPEIWNALRGLTAARIGLARSGASLATAPLLELRLAHARARDAVHAPLDYIRLTSDLATLGVRVLTLSSAALDRQQFLMRPDLGRRLAADAAAVLAPYAGSDHDADCYDLVFVISDGLSAHAVQTHAEPVLAAALPALRSAGWRIAPLVIALHGRVAIGDAIAGVLRATIVVVLIGERPGLSAPDSMGAYLTYRPTPQTTDAQRNCISNIRPAGLGYAEAAYKLTHLLQAMRTRGISGVALKDDADGGLIGE
jgi:ethanolamine ammonia-lyase small subunit